MLPSHIHAPESGHKRAHRLSFSAPSYILGGLVLPNARTANEGHVLLQSRLLYPESPLPSRPRHRQGLVAGLDPPYRRGALRLDLLLVISTPIDLRVSLSFPLALDRRASVHYSCHGPHRAHPLAVCASPTVYCTDSFMIATQKGPASSIGSRG